MLFEHNNSFKGRIDNKIMLYDLPEILDKRDYKKDAVCFLHSLSRFAEIYAQRKKEGKIVDFMTIPSREIGGRDGTYTILVKQSLDAKVTEKVLEAIGRVPQKATEAFVF